MFIRRRAGRKMQTARVEEAWAVKWTVYLLLHDGEACGYASMSPRARDEWSRLRDQFKPSQGRHEDKLDQA